jgi:hypothetical protein
MKSDPLAKSLKRLERVKGIEPPRIQLGRPLSALSANITKRNLLSHFSTIDQTHTSFGITEEHAHCGNFAPYVRPKIPVSAAAAETLFEKCQPTSTLLLSVTLTRLKGNWPGSLSAGRPPHHKPAMSA